MESKDVDSIGKLQQLLNKYLGELCRQPKKEFMKFLHPRTRNPGEAKVGSAGFNDAGSHVSSDSVLQVEKRLAQGEQDSREAVGYLKRLWCREDLIDVGIKICYSSFADEIYYTVSVAYKDLHYQREKSIIDISEFYSRLKTIFKGIQLPELPIPPMSALNPKDKISVLDHSAMAKLSDCFQLILNDADFLCSEIYRFFGCEVMKIYSYIYQTSQAHYRQTKNTVSMQQQLRFQLAATVGRYSFEVDRSNEVRMV